MECITCKNKFKNQSTLNYHRKTALYCLKLQGKTGKNKIMCVECKKFFSRKHDLIVHKKICKNQTNDRAKISILEEKLKEKDIYINELRKEKDTYIDELRKEKDTYIDELKAQISDLQNRFANIVEKAATRPTTSVQNNSNSNNNNNNRLNQIVNNLLPLTDEYMKDQVKHLTLEHIKKGIPGYVSYALEYPLKDRVKCVDFGRRKVVYKNAEGDVISDPETTRVSSNFFKTINPRNEEIILERMKIIQDEMFNPLDEKKELTEREAQLDQIRTDKLLAEARQLSSQKIDIINIAEGLKPEFLSNFSKTLCSNTTI